MARKNSIQISAESVEVLVDKKTQALTIKIKNPSEPDLIRLISECSNLLNWRRTRNETL